MSKKHIHLISTYIGEKVYGKDIWTRRRFNVAQAVAILTTLISSVISFSQAIINSSSNRSSFIVDLQSVLTSFSLLNVLSSSATVTGAVRARR